MTSFALMGWAMLGAFVWSIAGLPTIPDKYYVDDTPEWWPDDFGCD